MLPTTRRHGRRPAHHGRRRTRRASSLAQARDGVRGRSVSRRNADADGTWSMADPLAAQGEGCRWSFVAPVAIVAGLFGASTAMVIAGLYGELEATFGGLAREHILAGAFLALAVGVRVPQRLTMWAFAILWERVIARNRSTNVSNLLVARGSADRPLYWIVLSGIALLAGVTIAVLPGTIALVSAFYAWLQVHFVWSAMPLDMLHVALAFGVGLAPLMTLGLALSCAHHMSCQFGRWDIRATGWQLLGASVGAWCYAESASRHVSARTLLVVASIPALLVALLAAGVFSKYRENHPLNVDDADTLPMRSDRWPTLLRASIVIVGGCAALCAAIACHLILTTHDLHPRIGSVIVPLALMLLGIGVLLGCRVKPPGTRTLHGFGLCTVTSGGAAVIASLALARVTQGGLTGEMLASGAMLVILGFTTGYGRQLLMASVASRSSEGSKMTARLLIWVALAVGIFVPVARVLGVQAELIVVTAMGLLTLGGVMMACDPFGVVWTDRVRSGAIVMSLVVLALMVTGKHSPWRPLVPPTDLSALETATPSQNHLTQKVVASPNPYQASPMPIIPAHSGRSTPR